MRALLTIGLMTTALLVGCGDSTTDSTGTNNRSGSFPKNSKWTEAKFDSTTQACASRGSQSGSTTYNEWLSFCGCVYGVASTRWEFEDFSNNFQTYYDELVSDNTIGRCLQDAGLTGN